MSNNSIDKISKFLAEIKLNTKGVINNWNFWDNKELGCILLKIKILLFVLGLLLFYIFPSSISIKLWFDKPISINLCTCLVLSYCVMALSNWAILRFKNDVADIIDEADKYLIEKDWMKEYPQKITSYVFLTTVIGSILLSFIIVGLIINFYKWEKIVTIYSIIIAVISIFYIIAAFTYAVCLVQLIRGVLKKEFKVDNTVVYPLSISLFSVYYNMYFHGIILFWSIGLLTLALTTIVFLGMLSISGAEPNYTPIFLMIIVYICMCLGFFLSTFYPYYITQRKVENIKLDLIGKLNISQKDEIQFIQNSPNILRTSTEIRAKSTIAAFVSLVISAISFLCEKGLK